MYLTRFSPHTPWASYCTVILNVILLRIQRTSKSYARICILDVSPKCRYHGELESRSIPILLELNSPCLSETLGSQSTACVATFPPETMMHNRALYPSHPKPIALHECVSTLLFQKTGSHNRVCYTPCFRNTGCSPNRVDFVEANARYVFENVCSVTRRRTEKRTAVTWSYSPRPNKRFSIVRPTLLFRSNAFELSLLVCLPRFRNNGSH